MIPMIDSPQVAFALAARWHRARTLVLVSMAALPALTGLVCLPSALLPRLDVPAMSWWSAIPALAASLSVIALVVWLRRDGLTDPASWFPATVLMTGSQLVLGVVPGFGIAVRSAAGAAVVVKTLLAVGLLSAGSAWSLSRRAHRSLLDSPVPELGATPLRLVFHGHLSRIAIGTDRVDWTIRVSGSRLDAGVSFGNLRDVSVTVKSSDGALALVLHTSSGRWSPIHTGRGRVVRVAASGRDSTRHRVHHRRVRLGDGGRGWCRHRHRADRRNPRQESPAHLSGTHGVLQPSAVSGPQRSPGPHGPAIRRSCVRKTRRLIPNIHKGWWSPCNAREVAR
ncbi:hypothetical protein ACFOWZ_36820 [Lentzea rhizosphaerae]|uniref:Uncharacterized protein n=1 Tax=Lentzea rhizosphaerae TaxID=2041025 RepID=A0ABV8C4X6_9PSEU